MPILTLRRVLLGFGGFPLLDGVDLAIEPGERLCLVGRNGAGKSTLLKVLNGSIVPDDGEISRQQGLVVAQLAQEVPPGMVSDVFSVVAAGLGEQGRLLAAYHEASHQLASDPQQLERLSRIQHELEAVGGWQLNQRVEAVLSRLSLDGEAQFANLSGGLKRRVMLAQALVQEPDLLLLDEPTNHLDIDAIAWLEDFLLGWRGTLLFITHDRAFLQRLATRIIEMDRGRLTSWPGDYATYLRRKQEALEAEAQANALFDKRLAAEEVWIRQGIKARRTRNEGRVRALKQLREERRQRRERSGVAKLQVNEAERSGKLVVEAEHVTCGYGDRVLIRDFSTSIMRGDRIGIIGPNGVGKSTLLRVLLGELKPDSGTLRHGTRLDVAYFDQQRAQLDEELSVLDNLAEGRDQVVVNGQPRHVISYLQDFLFPPERTRSPVKSLSGGERNRLLLARLFLKPANMLVMDEPTNDLDVETLELLEELLTEYPGTLLLVSHDRAFLDNVVTSTLVFEGDGRIGEYVGGYADWLRQRPAPAAVKPVEKPKPVAAPAPVPDKPAVRKLSYKEQRELAELPGRIEALEQELQVLQAALAAPDFYRQESAVVGRTTERLAACEQELNAAYERWAALEG